jgi:uncharacterized repeat protein (TIGR01451 family)
MFKRVMTMRKHNTARTLAHAVSLSLAAAAVHAATPSPAGGACVGLDTQALQEQVVAGADGARKTTLAPATKVVPGDQVVWQTTARNSCASPAANVVINQAVPEHMTLVADSVVGADARVLYSLDGKSFVPLADLVVTEADGTRRPARTEDVRQMRWLLNGSIGANQSVSVRYSARLR